MCIAQGISRDTPETNHNLYILMQLNLLRPN